MENRNNFDNSSNVTADINDSNRSQSVASVDFGRLAPDSVVPLDSNTQPQPTPRPTVSPQTNNAKHLNWKKIGIIAAIVATIILIMIGASLVAYNVISKKSVVSNSLASQYNSTQIPLSDFSQLSASSPNLIGTRTLTINGSLVANGPFMLSPSTQPSNANRGEIYYDQNSNQLAYYNGAQFVNLGSGVQSVGGQSGIITVGQGLTSAGGQISNSGVLTLQGQTGNVNLVAGTGIAVSGTTLTNLGVTGLGGQTGNITIGSGLSAASGTLQNTGLISAASGSANITVTNDGAGNITISSNGAGSGTVQSPGGTAGRLAVFTGVQTIADSLISETGTTVTVNGSLGVTSSLTLGSALTVGNGGTGTTALALNGVVIGQGAGSLTAVTASGPGLCLVSTSAAPAFASCTGTANVSSLDGLTGALLLANSSGSGSTITINDASTTQKGIAQFNSTNFSASGGIVNTIQDIAVASTPTFGRLALSSSQATSPMLLVNNTNIAASGNLIDLQLNGTSRLSLSPAGNMLLTGTVNGQTISSAASFTGSLSVGSTLTAGTLTSTAGLTVGDPAKSLLLQGNSAGTSLAASSSGLTSSLTFQTPTANVTYRLLTAAAGTYDVCTTVGNCTGVGGGVTTTGGTTNTLAKFTGSQSIGNSIISDNGTTVSIGGVLAVNTITPTGALTIGATTQGLTLQGAATTLSSTSAGITNTLTFATPTSTNKTITIPNATGTVAVSASGAISLDANGNITCPSCLTGTAVSSLNSLTGALSIANASGVGTTITINDASTTQKGIAQFNGANFSASSGVIDTIQNIGVAATPTFGDLTLTSSQATSPMLFVNNTNVSASGNLLDIQLNSLSRLSLSPSGNMTLSGTVNGQTISSSANFTGTLGVTGAASLNGGASVTGTLTANTITPNAAMSVGATSQSLTLQGNASTTLSATSGASTSTLAFQTPTANVTYRLLTAAAGTYDICTTVGNCAGVGGGVTTPGGTTNTIPKFTGSQTLGNSIITDNGSTVTVGGVLAVNTITPSGIMTIGSTSQNLTLQGATTTLSDTASGITNTLTFATPTTSNKTITVPNASGTVAVSASGAISLDASGNITCPSCVTSAVSSLNGLTGALAIANASGAGTTITINDASTSQKGIAQFNSTNFSASSGTINTVQNINTSATPTFGTLTLSSSQLTNPMFLVNNTNAGASGNLLDLQVSGSSKFSVAPSGNMLLTGTINGQTISSSASFSGTLGVTGAASLNGGASVTGTLTANTITPNSAMTVGATGQSLTLQGNASTTVTATSGVNTTTLAFQAPTASVTYRFLTTAAGTYDICTTQGNCAGVGGGVTTTGGTTNHLAKFTNSSGIGDSIITDNGSTVTIGGVLAVNTVTPSAALTIGATSQSFTLQGSATSSITATNGASTTTVNFQSPTANVTYRFLTAAAGSYDICTTAGNCLGGGGGGANTSLSNLTGVAINTSLLPGSAGSVDLGSAALPFGKLYLAGNSATPGTNNFTITGTPTGVRTITLPDASGTVCIDTNNCSYVSLQSSSPGSAQTGNINVSGVVIAGTSVQTSLLNTADTASASSALTLRSGNTTGGTGLGTGNVTIKSGDGSGTNTSSGNVTIDAGSATGSGTSGVVSIGNSNASSLTVGRAAAALTLQGNSSTTLTANSGGNSTSVTFQAPTAAVTYRFATAAAGSYDICTSAGNCAGVGGGVTTPGGTTNTIPKFTGAQTLGNSGITDDGTTVSIGENLSVAANKNFTLASGSGTVSQTFSGSTGTANTLAATITASSGTNTLQGLAINLGGTTNTTGSNTVNGINFGNVTPATNNTFNGLNFGTGFNSLITLGSTQIISGTGLVQNAALDSSLTYSNLTKVGTLTAGAIASGFGTISTANTITGTTLNGTTGINSGTGAGTQRIDGSGNLVNIGTVTTSGAINGQTISSSASFSGTLGVTGAASLNGGASVTGTLNANTITPTAAMTVGATGQALTLQGNASSVLTATGGGFTTTIGFTGTPTANVTYNFDRAATTGVYTICTTAGNCNGLGAVTSLDGLNGALTIANTTGSGSTITINDASTSQKGIAQFNSTNFSASSGTINTIQNINTSAAPTFGQLTLSSSQATGAMLVVNNTNVSASGNLIDLQLNGSSKFSVAPNGNAIVVGTLSSGNINGQTISSSANLTGTLTEAGLATFNGGATVVGTFTANNITPTGPLTLGATGQAFTLQGTASSSITATGGGFTTTVGFTGTPAGAVTYNFDRSATAGTYTICTSAGNCTGAGNFIQNQYASAQTANFYIQGNGDHIVGAVRAAVGQTSDIFQVQDSTGSPLFQISGNTNFATLTDNLLIKGQQSSPAALVVQTSNNGGIVGFDLQRANTTSVARITNDGLLALGNSGSLIGGSIAIEDGTTGHYGNIIGGSTLTADRNYTMPNASGTFCLTSGTFGGGNCDQLITLQNAYTASAGGSTPEIKLITANQGLDIQDADTSLGSSSNFISFRSSNSAGLGNIVFGLGIQGNIFMQPSADSTSFIDINNHSNGNLLEVDSQNNRVGIGQGGSTLPSYTLDVGGDANIASGGAYRIGGTSTLTSGGLTFSAASTNNIQAASGQTLSLFGSTVSIQSAATTGVINIGNVNNNNTINIGAVSGSGTNGSTVHIADSTTTIGTQTVSIGSAGNSGNATSIFGGSTGGINIGTGTNQQTVNIGSNGNANTSVSLDSGASGAITIGNTTSNHTISIGTASGGIQTVTVGSTNSSSTLTLQGGTGGISVQAAATGGINIGTTNSNAIAMGNGANTYSLNSTSLKVSTAGVITLAGNQAADITSSSAGGAGTDITIQPAATTTANGLAKTIRLTGASSTSSSCATACAGGNIILQGGNATGGSGNAYGGDVYVDSGTGRTMALNGKVGIGTTNAAQVVIGNNSNSNLYTEIDGGVTDNNAGTTGYIAMNGQILQNVNLNMSGTSRNGNPPIGANFVAGANPTTVSTTEYNALSGYMYVAGTNITGAYGAGVNGTVEAAGNLLQSFGVEGGSIADTGATITNGDAIQGTNTTHGGNITNSYTFHAYNGNTGGGGTITNQYGLYVENQTVGTTLNYGVYIAGGSTAALYSGGDVLTKTTSATALRVQDGTGSTALTVDTSADKVTIGPTAGDTVGARLVLGNKTNAGDPTGTSGAMYYNSSMNKFRCFEGGANGYWRDCLQSARTSYYYYNDMFHGLGATASGFVDDTLAFTASGTGTTNDGSVVNGLTGHAGIVESGTGTTNTGNAGWDGGDNFPILLANGDYWRFETDVRVPTLSNGTQTFTYRAGFENSATTDGTDGCFFKYNDTTNSGKWQGTCLKASSAGTCDTGITVVAGTWYRLTVVVNSAGNSVDFQINGTSACQITTVANIPTTNAITWGAYITKSVGTTARVVDTDYVEVQGQFSSSR